MVNLIKLPALKSGDKVSTISLSWGGAGDKEILWRYNQGKKRVQEEFALEVVEMEHTLKGSGYLYNHLEEKSRVFYIWTSEYLLWDESNKNISRNI